MITTDQTHDTAPSPLFVKRELGGWSFNDVSLYIQQYQRYVEELRESLKWAEAHNEGMSWIFLQKALAHLSDMNATYNRANNSEFRLQALLAEVKANRSGVAVSYIRQEDDPARDDFTVKPITTEEVIETRTTESR